MQTHKDLKVWQRSVSFTTEIYKISQGFPREELFALTSQIRRAAYSIPMNIAEGYGRGANKDYAHFLSIARGSLYELDTQLNIAVMLDFITTEQTQEALILCEECGRMLNTMIKKIAPPRPNA